MMRPPIRRLPDAEQAVMQAIWACQAPVTRADIEKILYRERTMATTTLLTLLTRLAEKEFITIEKVGRRSCYIPCISQEDYLAVQGRNFFEQLCGRNISTFAAALCDSGLTREELAQLRSLLERDEL